MTKKDYQAIARGIYNMRENQKRAGFQYVEETTKNLLEALYPILKGDNVRFDYARFEEACLTGTCKGMTKA